MTGIIFALSKDCIFEETLPLPEAPSITALDAAESSRKFNSAAPLR
jgi:hypothetical protein